MAEKNYYKIKEVDGAHYFIKSVKDQNLNKWVDGDKTTALEGRVTDLATRDNKLSGGKDLVVTITKFDGTADIITTFFDSFVAQGILNTLAGGNGFDLTFALGKRKDSKKYAQLWINKPDRGRTNWLYKIEDLPKVTMVVDEDGNKIKKGLKASEIFWMGVMERAKDDMTQGVSVPPKANKYVPKEDEGDLQDWLS